MNEVAEVIGLSTSPKTAITKGATPTGMTSSASATLDILPLGAKRYPNPIGWYRGRQRLGQFMGLMPGWNGANGVAPNRHTVVFAATELAGLEKAGIPAPTVNPSADGAVYAEWHMSGIELEMIFEAPYKVIALVEDSRGIVPSFDGEDPNLKVSLKALQLTFKWQKSSQRRLLIPRERRPGGLCSRSSSLYLDSGILMRCRLGVDTSRMVRPTITWNGKQTPVSLLVRPSDSTAAEQQQALAALNASWDALPDGAAASGIRGRLRTLPLTVD